MSLRLSIVIITKNRPEVLAECLRRAGADAPPDTEFIVVDSSDDDRSQDVIREFGRARSVRLRGETNNMPRARNQGIAVATGDVMAFLDDDSYIEPGWAAAVLGGYDDPETGAVSGRVLDGDEQPVPEEGAQWPRLLPDGRLAGEVRITATQPRAVDFFRGCNMTFRAEALNAVGGFDENLTGNNFREDTDCCLRLKKAGWRLSAVPGAHVHHIRAPRHDIQRNPFALRTRYYNTRNHVYMTLKVLGLRPAALLRMFVIDPLHLLGATIKNFWRPRFWGALAGGLLGLWAGTFTGLFCRRKTINTEA